MFTRQNECSFSTEYASIAVRICSKGFEFFSSIIACLRYWSEHIKNRQIHNINYRLLRLPDAGVQHTANAVRQQRSHATPPMEYDFTAGRTRLTGVVLTTLTSLLPLAGRLFLFLPAVSPSAHTLQITHQFGDSTRYDALCNVISILMTIPQDSEKLR